MNEAVLKLPPGVVVQDQSSEFVCGTVGNIVQLYWRTPASVGALTRIEPLFKKWCDEFKQGFALMVIALSPKPPESPREVNAKSGAIVKACGTSVVGVAYLFTDEGPMSKLVKLSLNITFMLSGASQKGFSSTPEACEWLCGELRNRGALQTTPAQLADVTLKMIAAAK